MSQKIKQPVHIHINELILSGFKHVDRRQLSETVIAELSRLIAQRGVPRSLTAGGYIARLDGGSFQIAEKAGADTIGTDLARTLYGRIKA
jgi:hypothetical protein